MPDAIQVIIGVGEGTVEISRDWLVLRTSEGRELEFRCLHKGTRVLFEGESPFRESEFQIPQGGGCLTGPALRGRERRDPYKFAVEIRGRSQFLRREFELYVDP